jgi:hypothetical protein
MKDSFDNQTSDLFVANRKRGRPATGNAKSPSERMREHRCRVRHGMTGGVDGGEKELSLKLSLTAANALRRMAKSSGVTQKDFLDKLLRDTEDSFTSGFSDAQVDDYYL